MSSACFVKETHCRNPNQLEMITARSSTATPRQEEDGLVLIPDLWTSLVAEDPKPSALGKASVAPTALVSPETVTQNVKKQPRKQVLHPRNVQSSPELEIIQHDSSDLSVVVDPPAREDIILQANAQRVMMVMQDIGNCSAKPRDQTQQETTVKAVKASVGYSSTESLHSVYQHDNPARSHKRSVNKLAPNAQINNHQTREMEVSSMPTVLCDGNPIKKHETEVREYNHNDSQKVKVSNMVKACEATQGDNHRYTPHWCPVCNESVGSMTALYRHTRSVHPEVKRPHQCSFCESSFSHINALLKHVNGKHRGSLESSIAPKQGESVYLHDCIRCKARFVTVELLLKHIVNHDAEDEKPHRCSVCGVGFMDQRKLERHCINFSCVRGCVLRCPVCDESFRERETVLSHMTSIHPHWKPFKCRVCSYSACEKRLLIRHLKRVHIAVGVGYKPHMCSTCSAAYRTKCALEHHVRIHTGEKPHECNVCHVSFRLKEQLIGHLISLHTGEKPYKCTVCGVGFSLKLNLIPHMRIHTGEKPYKCKVCGVGFARQDNVKQHMRSHTGERPYTCSVCGGSFSRSDNFKRHMAKHKIQDR